MKNASSDPFPDLFDLVYLKVQLNLGHLELCMLKTASKIMYYVPLNHIV